MKRLMMMAAAILTLLMAQAQEAKYKITGKVPEGVEKVYLNVAGTRAVADSSAVSDGHFSLSGTAPRDEVLVISLGDDEVYVINDGAPVNIDVPGRTLDGSELNKKLHAYELELSVYYDEARKLYAEYAAIKGDTTVEGKAKIEALSERFEVIDDELSEKQKAIAKANKASLIPAVYINKLSYGLGYDDLKELLDESAPYYNLPSMATAKRLLASLEKRKVGKMFMDMTMNDTDGQPRKLSEWCGKGNYVLIDFWASWCGPCLAELPNVVANYKKYHDKGFEIVGVSLDSKADAWKAAIKLKGLDWPQVSDLKAWKSDAVVVYGVNSIPASVLLDGDGKIVALDLRGAALGEKLKEIYGF